jgi:hypothetical protein
MSRLSSESIKKIIFLYQNSTPILDIAIETHVTKWAIYYQIQQYKRRGYILKYRPCKTKTEIRVCNCGIQDCKGRFISKKGNAYDVCPYEAIRRGYLKSISEYYK